MIDEDSAERMGTDTTVMEKNIAYPTDARLYERAREQLAALAQEAGVDLRQSYARLAPRLALEVGRYAHAKQYRRMRKALKRLKGYTGRVMNGHLRGSSAVLQSWDHQWLRFVTS